MSNRIIGGISLFLGILGLCKFLFPGYWEYISEHPNLYAELPFTFISVAINTAMIVVGLYMLLNVNDRHVSGADAKHEQ